MQPDALLAAKEWMAHADRDLLAAEKLLTNPPILTGPAAFHTQQAAEKALKALLTAAGQTFAKTHDLNALIVACIAVAPGIQQFVTHALLLRPFVVEFRYPEGAPDPDETTVRDALHMASEIVEFVRVQLSGESDSDQSGVRPPDY